MRLREILLATNNRHKVREIKKMLDLKGLKILCLDDIKGRLCVKEDLPTFAGNAAKKAKAAAKKFGLISVSDDSGLCVKALKGAPGVRSARFVRPPVTSERLCAKLLDVMASVPPRDRGAAFQCFVALADPKGKCIIVKGACRGKIASKMQGDGGFGYDPVFIPSGHSKTFAQMTERQKNLLSHRGQAFRRLKKLLRMI